MLPKAASRKRQYDGWLAYTWWNYPQGIDAFLGYFSVPNNPKRSFAINTQHSRGLVLVHGPSELELDSTCGPELHAYGPEL